MQFSPTLPFSLILSLGGFLLVITVWLYWLTSARLGVGQRLSLLTLRLLGTAAVILLLLQPSRIEEIPKAQHNRAVIFAVDSSLSMTQADEGGASRLDAARKLLRDNGFLKGGVSQDADIRLFQFDSDAVAIAPEKMETLRADGETTQFHRSIGSMVDSVSDTDIEAMIFLSDGHDFEMENATRTAEIARRKRFPIFAIPFGSTGNVRDIAVRIDNYQPYAYVNQTTRVSGRLRLIGCEYETLTVQLLRNGKLVSTQKVTAGEEPEIPVAFTIKEPETGQFQYEVKAVITGKETDLNNNNAFTYLNVIDEKIRVLILEGSPYWDTTFLQRSLYRNDKIELDAILAFAEGRARRVRNDNVRGQLPDPLKPEDYQQYDAIILGRSLNRLLDPDLLGANLKQYVDSFGGTLIFARGRALDDENEALAELEPVLYDSGGNSDVQISVASTGRGLAAFQMLHDKLKTSESLPPLLAARRASGSKTLAATLAEAEDPQTGQKTPVFVHRRFGKGQVLNINVAGLWKWSFNAKTDVENNIFDRFWDQLLIWMLSQSEVVPNRDFSFRTSSANLLLGEPMDFKLSVRKAEFLLGLKPIRIFRDGKLVTELRWGADDRSGNSARTVFTPEVTGHYEARVKLPNGEEMGQKFMVYEERPEMTEVTTDLAYLTRLCHLTGGSILDRDNLDQLSRTLALQKKDSDSEIPDTRLVPIWDRFSVFFAIVMLFGADWMLRRRWGLA